LADGFYAMTEDSGSFTGIYSLDHPDLFHPVAQVHASELVKLAQGQLGPNDDSDLLSELEREGFLAQSSSGEPDPKIVQTLQALGAPFRWRVHPEHLPILEKVRLWHAHRKLFVFEFGQTPCLPETVLCRVQLATETLPAQAKVLLIGDDDLMCLALAEMGFEVTVVDIDPALIDFIHHRCQTDGIQVDARVQDLLQPIPEDMRGCFDLVITDPMSFEGCLIAFLSRALAMLNDEGVVWTCIHPLAHQLFSKVAQVLPIAVDGHAAYLSAYYYRRYEKNTYRSDLFRLKKTAKALPYGPEETIPFEAITEGELTATRHGYVTCHLAPKNETEQDAHPLAHLASHATLSQGEGHFHFAQTLKEGYLTGAMNPKRTQLHMQLFPFSETQEDQQSQHVLRELQVLNHKVEYIEAPFLAPPIPQIKMSNKS